MTDFTRPISASNPPPSRGTRTTLSTDIVISNTEKLTGELNKVKVLKKSPTRTVDVGANPK